MTTKNLTPVTFSPQTTFAVGTNPQAMSVVDTNHDGNVDVITANTNGNNISVLLGDGRGNFSGQTTFAVDGYPVSISVADMNNDGNIDVITANASISNISVLLGDGRGNFAAQTTFAVGDHPNSVSVADLNNDDDADLVTANWASQNISVLLGNGRGNFTAQTTFSVGTNPLFISAVDVNNDHNADVIAANINDHNVSVLVGDGLGNFATQAPFVVGTNPTSVSVMDVDGDGNVDLITANQGSNNVSVLIGDGHGDFTRSNTFSVGTNPRFVQTADMNDDGNEDVITTNSNSDNLSVLIGDGRGNFAPQTTFSVGSNPQSVSVSDVNGDGKPDLVTANQMSNNVSVLLNTTEGTFVAPSKPDVKPVEVQHSPTGKIQINGNAIQDEMLSIQNTLNDEDGLGTISYQWLSNGSQIANATQSSYTLTQSDAGKTISTTASYTDGLGKLESVSSNAVNVANENDKPTGDVIITGTPTQKQTLKATNTLADLDGLGGVSYQWKADGTPVGTGDRYVLTQAEVGKTITVLVNYTDGQGTAESVISDATEQIADVNDPLMGSVNVTGKLVKGQMLTATDTLKDADGLGDFSYQWLSNGTVIDNATDKTYLLGRSEIGKKISVKVSYTDGSENLESTISKETVAVKNDGAINGLTKVGDATKNKLIGAAKNDDLSGLAGADTLIGNAGNDILDGGTGNDSLDGGNGNDELLGGDGDDTLLGGSGNDRLDAGIGNDKLVGGLGNDTLKGGLGVDTMEGGDGNDYYFVDNLKDVIIETNKNSTLGGVDTVESTSDYVLPENIENFVLKDSQGKGHSGTGNKADNVITGSIGDDILKGMAGNDKLNGSDGNDMLDGGLGMDTLTGGNGSDVYIINNLEDKIIETAKGGDEDQIISTVTYDLETAPNVEMLTLSGAKAMEGNGNDLNNLLQEQDGGKVENVFDGGAGDDTMNGAGGNDALTGGEGNDVIDGGDGKDVAIFTGAFINYQITRNPDAEGVDQILVVYVGNQEDGEIDEGTDSLSNVEMLQFADGETINTRDVTDSSAMLIITGTIL